MAKPQDPDKVLKQTVERTIDAVADYVESGPRNAEETVEKVIETVDNEEVKDALEGFDEKRAHAMDIRKQDTFEEHEARMNKINEKNVETGQQGTNEPWKEPAGPANGRPRSNDDVVDEEVKKRKAADEKARG
jgi:hypothetical protein